MSRATRTGFHQPPPLSPACRPSGPPNRWLTVATNPSVSDGGSVLRSLDAWRRRHHSVAWTLAAAVGGRRPGVRRWPGGCWTVAARAGWSAGRVVADGSGLGSSVSVSVGSGSRRGGRRRSGLLGLARLLGRLLGLGRRRGAVSARSTCPGSRTPARRSPPPAGPRWPRPCSRPRSARGRCRRRRWSPRAARTGRGRRSRPCRRRTSPRWRSAWCSRRTTPRRCRPRGPWCRSCRRPGGSRLCAARPVPPSTTLDRAKLTSAAISSLTARFSSGAAL